MSDLTHLHRAARAARDAHRPGMPVARPKLAATLVLTRDGPDGPEILTGRRNPAHKFMPGKYVFPGGRVDPGDARAPCDGPLNPDDAAILARTLPPARAHAAPLAAIRETYEETGLLVGRAGACSDASAGASGGETWTAFARQGVTPAVSRLRLLGRAITPTSRPMRFDAYFFLAKLEDLDCDTHQTSSRELDDIGWRTIAHTRTLDVPTITRFVLDQAEGFLTRRAPPLFIRTVAGRGRASIMTP